MTIIGKEGVVKMELVQQTFVGVSSVSVCEICGRPLKNPASVAAGMGPICRGKGNGHDHAGTTEKPMDMSGWGTRFFYVSPNGLQSWCYILVNGNTVIATEAPDNPGMSITNAAEAVAATACGLYRIPLDELEWFEHYIHPESEGGETFDLVTFAYNSTSLSRPKWIHSTREQAMARFTT